MLKTSVKILGVSCLALCLVFFTSLSAVAEKPDNPGKGQEKLVRVSLTGDLSGATITEKKLLKSGVPITVTMDGPLPAGTYKSGTLKLVKHHKELSFSHSDITLTVYGGVFAIDRKTKVENITFNNARAVVDLDTPDEMRVTVICVVIIAPQ